ATAVAARAELVTAVEVFQELQRGSSITPPKAPRHELGAADGASVPAGLDALQTGTGAASSQLSAAAAALFFRRREEHLGPEAIVFAWFRAFAFSASERRQRMAALDKLAAAQCSERLRQRFRESNRLPVAAMVAV
ncbi:unnamed protein product, partial [Polarella glacialis]